MRFRNLRHGIRTAGGLFAALLLLTLPLDKAAAHSGHGAVHLDHPLGKRELAWKPGREIARVLSLNFDFHAGDTVISWSEPARLERIEGRDCVVGAHVLFDVNDAFMFDGDETVELELTFAKPRGGFILSYDHAVAPVASEHLFDAAPDTLWHTERLRLERARFANRKYAGTDFSIAGLGSQLDRGGGANDEIALCGLRITRAGDAAERAPAGRLELLVADGDGRPVAARVGIYRADGWAPLAGDSTLPVQRYYELARDLPMLSVPRGWSDKGRYAFFIQGSYAADLPAGEYEIFVMKGPEYRMSRAKISVAPGEAVRREITLERWRDMPAEGWYSGDDHIHVSRPTDAENAAISAYMQAEDIHVANLLEMGNLAGSAFPQYAFGEAGHHHAGDHVLVSGQESPRTSHRGHSIGLNGREFYWFERDYFIYDRTADALHADGGLWGYAHISTNAFNVGYGIALDVPRGKVDFLEILQLGLMDTGYLYDMLNLGFPIVPSAGSDYPYLDLPGTERVYVKSGSRDLPASWFEGLKSSRSFVANWPVLDIAVNGDSDAVEYELERGDRVKIVARAAVNPDFDRIARLELVVQGEVAARAESADGAEELVLEHELAVDRSLWLAVRAAGHDGGLAHSTPIFLYVDGDRNFANWRKVPELARKYIALLRDFGASEPKLAEEWERASVNDLVLPRWQDAKAELDRAIEDAIAIYEGLIARAEGSAAR